LKRKDVLNAVIALSVVIFILDILIYYDVLTDNALPFAFTVEEMSILISLLPLALIVIMCLLYRGEAETSVGRCRCNNVDARMGIPCGSVWGISLRAQLGQPLKPLLVYNMIGLILLAIAIFVFRRGIEG